MPGGGREWNAQGANSMSDESLGRKQLWRLHHHSQVSFQEGTNTRLNARVLNNSVLGHAHQVKSCRTFWIVPRTSFQYIDLLYVIRWLNSSIPTASFKTKLKCVVLSIRSVVTLQMLFMLNRLTCMITQHSSNVISSTRN